jgi:hypothetical protein
MAALRKNSSESFALAYLTGATARSQQGCSFNYAAESCVYAKKNYTLIVHIFPEGLA